MNDKKKIRLVGDMLVENKLVSKDQVDAALKEQQHVRVIREKRQLDTKATTPRQSKAQQLRPHQNLIFMMSARVAIFPTRRISKLITTSTKKLNGTAKG